MKTTYFYKKVKYRLFLLMAIFFTISCEDFLEEQPTTLIDADYVYTTEEGLKSGVVSLYKFYRDRYDQGTEDYMGGVVLPSRSDLAFSRSGYTGLMGRYERGVSPVDLGSQFVSSLFWKRFYTIANKATDIINAAEDLDSLDEESRDKIIAEAKFFRALSYFFLYRMYNNIYVSTETVTVETAFEVIQNKSTKEEIFALLNSDLAFAVDHLDWNVTFGRVSKGTAKHIKAKVALWEGNWTEARNQAVSVIEDPDSPHSLVPSTADVFKGDRNHSEQLFVIQSQDNILGGGGTTMINANFVTQYFQIPGINAETAQGGRGFSRVLPNLYLQGLLAADPNDTRDNDTYFRLKYYYNDGPNSGQEITIYQPITDLNNPSRTYTTFYQRLHPSTLKYTQDDDDPNSYLQRSNIMVYRLAETYLLAAEAILRSGSGDPLPYINAVRTRANAAPLTSVTLQDILDENARELAFEGERWFTLKRFGAATLNFQMRNYAGDGPFFPNNFGGSRDPRVNWQDYFINWPIFQEDLDLFGPSYPQNEGYN
tara:strand:+ start:31101 stop:32717 length:1617 start_codon:yes stop_codon:yes gene_type:complete